MLTPIASRADLGVEGGSSGISGTRPTRRSRSSTREQGHGIGGAWRHGMGEVLAAALGLATPI